MKSEQWLTDKVNKLLKELGRPETTETDFEVLADSIKGLKAEIKVQTIERKIKQANDRDKQAKAFLKALLELGEIDESLFTDSMDLHKTKAKKHPKLVEFIEKYDVRFGYKHREFVAKIYINNKFTQFTPQKVVTSAHGQLTTYRPYESFEEACIDNGIKVKPLRAKAVFKDIEKLEKETKKLQEQVKKYEQKKKQLNFTRYEVENLIERKSETVYTLWMPNN